MRKIGLLVGRERSFPDALIQEVNRREAGVVAEFVQLGGTRMAEPCPYHVLVDRISHEVPYYQLYLKNAVLSGTIVINNPFWRVADDKFFGTSLADKLGIAVPKTVVLPNKDYLEGIVSESLRNLIYPLDWDGIIQYVGLPAILKPHWGGGWRDVYRVESLLELTWRYDESGRKTMILQEFIEWDQYVRCLCIGQTNILPVVWDPTQPHFQRYRADAPPLDPVLSARVTADAAKLCQALGYDMNTVEFAIRDGVPYAIDFMNSAPDFDISSL
ncbi:MAG: glutathione synthase, partial [Chloroflexi bacterium RBG_16_57_9]